MDYRADRHMVEEKRDWAQLSLLAQKRHPNSQEDVHLHTHSFIFIKQKTAQ